MHRRWVFHRGQPTNACRKPRIGLADERAEILRIALDFRERNVPWLPQIGWRVLDFLSLGQSTRVSHPK